MKPFFTIVTLLQVFLIGLKIDENDVVGHWPWLIVLIPAELCLLALVVILYCINKIGDDV